ncbi:MAG: hypothetical protein EBZ36_15270 [Acidobacteria bacterium]|nr:hypothetical protein [Acidobacteriota bacterium]
MMKRFVMTVIGLGVFLTVSGLALAQGEKKTLSGNIVDKACSGRVAKAANPQEAAGGHSKKCALSDNCKASGFGVYSDGKFYEFDAKGAELAADALTKSGKEKGAVFKVTGKVSGDKIAVESITESE